MSDVVKGKRYRIVIEGTVTWVDSQDDEFSIRPDGVGQSCVDPFGCVSIEEIRPPLPAADGSVVKADGRTYHKLDNSDRFPWMMAGNVAGNWFTDSELAAKEWTLIYDAANGEE